jgi:hypothetical protein
LETFLTAQVFFHECVECSEHLSNCLGLPKYPISHLYDADKDFAHVKFFLMKLFHEGLNSMVHLIVIPGMKVSLL